MFQPLRSLLMVNAIFLLHAWTDGPLTSGAYEVSLACIGTQQDTDTQPALCVLVNKIFQWIREGSQKLNFHSFSVG